MKSSVVGHARRRIVGVTLGLAFAGLIGLARVSAPGVEEEPTPCCPVCGTKPITFGECQHLPVPGTDDIVCNDPKVKKDHHGAGYCIVTIISTEYCLFGDDEEEGIKCKTEEIQPPRHAVRQYLYHTPHGCPADKQDEKMELCDPRIHIALGENCKPLWLYCASCRIDPAVCGDLKNGSTLIHTTSREPNKHKCKMVTTNPTDPSPTDPTK